MIELLNCAASEMITQWSGTRAHLIHADPPWDYNAKKNGAAAHHYECMGTQAIVQDIVDARVIALKNAYLATWVAKGFFFSFVTTLAEIQRDVLVADQWHYLTKCVWVKREDPGGDAPLRRDIRPGIGFHVRGDHEDLILLRRGKPKPHRQIPSDCWVTPRTDTHSEKPQLALSDIAQLVRPDGLVAELYAGETASMGRACHPLGRRYRGCELHPGRWSRAQRRLEQGDLFDGYACG